MVELRSTRKRVDGVMASVSELVTPAIFGRRSEGKLELAQSQRAGLQRYNKTARGTFEQ